MQLLDVLNRSFSSSFINRAINYTISIQSIHMISQSFPGLFLSFIFFFFLLFFDPSYFTVVGNKIVNTLLETNKLFKFIVFYIDFKTFSLISTPINNIPLSGKSHFYFLQIPSCSMVDPVLLFFLLLKIIYINKNYKYM